MNVIDLKAKRPPARASAAGPAEDAGSPLERRVNDAESQVTAGADAVRFELSQLNQLIELLLKPPQIRRPHLSRPRSAAALPDEVARCENGERNSAGGPAPTPDRLGSTTDCLFQIRTICTNSRQRGATLKTNRR